MSVPDAIARRLDRPGLAVIVATLLFLVVFWPTVLSFGSVWGRFTYSHGYVVALVVLWIIWRRRGDLYAPEQDGWLPAVILLAGLSLLWLAATVTHVQVVHQALFPLIGVAWVAAVSGLGAARKLLPAVVVFFFAVPFWEVLVPPLQAMTVAVSGGAVGAMNIDAVIQREIITIPSGAFHVAESCAGLHFFMVGTLLGTLYAHFFLRRWRSRLGVIALAGGTALLSNWIRVSGLIVIGHVTQMQSELIVRHGTYGWVIFSVAFLGFFLVARWVEKRERRVGEGSSSDTVEGGPASRPPGGTVRRKVGWATAAAALGPLLYFGVGALPTAAAEGASIGESDGAWQRLSAAHERPFDWEPEYHGADARRSASWTDGARTVYSDAFFYEEQEQGAELINDRNRLAPQPRVRGDHVLWLREQDKWVREALVGTEGGGVLVWYWYRVAGVEAVSPAWTKALELWAFVRRKPAAEMIAISALCGAESCQEAQAALRDFLNSL